MEQNQFQAQLEKLLAGDPEKAVAAVREKTLATIEKHGGKLILFGIGELGRFTLDYLQKLGKPPVAIADNNPKLHGTDWKGVPVLSPQVALEKFPGALFVVTVYTSSPVKQQLTAMGADWIAFPDLAWCYPETFLPRAGLELPTKIFAESDQVRAALDIFADDASKQEYVGQLGWRATLDPSLLPAHLPAAETYFPEGVFNFRPDEVFVDCGAFDGDSIRAFFQRSGNEFKTVVALEPDPANRELFRKWMSTLPAEQSAKIKLEPYALGEKRETVFFNSTGTMASVVGSGSLEVQCAPLDEILGDIAPTYIKMDIEGAEPSAIRGGAKSIHRGRPVLAICLYHSQEHLWQIPQLIHSLEPDYRLFLRRHADECWEIMCYAVPPERCQS